MSQVRLQNTKRFDWVSIILIIVFVSSLFFLINILYEMRKDTTKCINSPFVYGASELEGKYNKDVYGTIFITETGTLHFNSTNVIMGERYGLN